MPRGVNVQVHGFVCIGVLVVPQEVAAIAIVLEMRDLVAVSGGHGVLGGGRHGSIVPRSHRERLYFFSEACICFVNNALQLAHANHERVPRYAENPSFKSKV